jgi:hypothetical protein
MWSSTLLGELRPAMGVGLPGGMGNPTHIEKVRARKVWYLTNRIARKVLAHTICVFVNKQNGNPPLQFELLIQP